MAEPKKLPPIPSKYKPPFSCEAAPPRQGGYGVADSEGWWMIAGTNEADCVAIAAGLNLLDEAHKEKKNG